MSLSYVSVCAVKEYVCMFNAFAYLRAFFYLDENMYCMQIKRAVVLSTWLYSLLLWLYIVARIIISRVSVYSRFLDPVPFFTFITLGIISFAVSFICLIVYLAIWGFTENNTSK